MGAEVKTTGKVRNLVLAGATVALAAFPSVAFAQAEPYTSESPQVLPTNISDEAGVTEPTGAEQPTRTTDRSEDAPAPAVAGLRVNDRGPGPASLPLTGADLTLFAMTGAAAIGTGSMVLRRVSR